MVFSPCFLIFLLTLHSELLRHTKPFEQHSLFLLEIADHTFLAFPLLELFSQFLLFKLFELLQFVQKIKFSFLMSINVFKSYLVCFLCIIIFQILTLNLSQNLQLLNKTQNTSCFYLKALVYSPTLWLMRVITIFLLYFRWSLISLLNSAFLDWLS